MVYKSRNLPISFCYRPIIDDGKTYGNKRDVYNSIRSPKAEDEKIRGKVEQGIKIRAPHQLGKRLQIWISQVEIYFSFSRNFSKKDLVDLFFIYIYFFLNCENYPYS